MQESDSLPNHLLLQNLNFVYLKKDHCKHLKYELCAANPPYHKTEFLRQDNRAVAVENDLFCEIDMSLRSGGFGEQIVAHNVLLAVAHAEKLSTAPICNK